MRKIFFLLLLFCNCVLHSFGQYTVRTIPDPKKEGQQYYVSNPDQILDANTVYNLNIICKSLDDADKAEVAVVVIHDYQGDDEIFDFATKLFRTWKIGKTGKNNGLLFLIVKDRRKYQFITGYGLEGDLTDYQLSSIGRQSLVPFFKNGQYSEGTLAAMQQISQQLGATNTEIAPQDNENSSSNIDAISDQTQNAEYESSEVKRKLLSTEKSQGFKFSKTNQYIIAALLFLLYILSDIRMQKLDDSESSQVLPVTKSILTYLFTGIFIIGFPCVFSKGWISPLLMVVIQGCILGHIRFFRIFKKKENAFLDIANKYDNISTWSKRLIFPILITPSLWFKWIKVKSYKNLAEKSNTPPDNSFNYKRLNWDEDNSQITKILSKNQQKENEINSILYQVWLNQSTGEKKILNYEGLYFSKYGECPSCHARTMPHKLTTIVITSATYSHSGKGERLRRCLNCKFKISAGFVILPRLQESSSSSSSSSSDSSSSSSSGSWGGGSTGGGGAGGSW